MVRKLHLAVPVRRSSSTHQPLTFVVPAFNQESIIVSSLVRCFARVCQLLDHRRELRIDGRHTVSLWPLTRAVRRHLSAGMHTQDVKEIYRSRCTALRVIDRSTVARAMPWTLRLIWRDFRWSSLPMPTLITTPRPSIDASAVSTGSSHRRSRWNDSGCKRREHLPNVDQAISGTHIFARFWPHAWDLRP